MAINQQFRKRMLILLCVRDGGLGNQLLTYHGLSYLGLLGNTRFYGFDRIADLLEMSNRERSRFSNTGLVRNLLTTKLYAYINNWIRGHRCKLSSMLWIKEDKVKGMAHSKNAKGIYFLHDSVFYGDEFHATGGLKKARIKAVHDSKAEEWFKKNGIDRVETLCFVHIRRGDYINWPCTKNAAVLPWRYYIKAMERARRIRPDIQFAFASNDHYYLEDMFPERSELVFLPTDDLECFSVMSKCRFGILSASTFSLCASLVGLDTGKSGYYIGPRYWAGHRVKEWYPEGCQYSHIEYIGF